MRGNQNRTTAKTENQLIDTKTYYLTLFFLFFFNVNFTIRGFLFIDRNLIDPEGNLRHASQTVQLNKNNTTQIEVIVQ